MAKKDDYIFRYRIRNWRTCNQALVQRGSITVWFDEDAINAWCNADPSVGPGTPKVYSDAAIQCALALKAVFHLSLRATQGFLASIMELMALDLPVPDYTTVSRRQRRLAVPLPESHHAHHIVVDATGLKVYGPGEWHAKKHPAKRRRSRRRLHLAVDETTKEIVAEVLTESAGPNGKMLPTLFDDTPGSVTQVSGDCAYDTRCCYEAILDRGAIVTILPRRNARLSSQRDKSDWRAARDQPLQRISGPSNPINPGHCPSERV